MWPRLGPLPTFGVLYSVSILSHFLIGYLIARRLGLRHRIWVVVGICYMVGMTFGAKVLYDIHNGQFDLRALFSISHCFKGGLWGGLLAYLVLAVPLVLILAKRRWEALDLVGLSNSFPGYLLSWHVYSTVAAMAKNVLCPGLLYFLKVLLARRRAYHYILHRFMKYWL